MYGFFIGAIVFLISFCCVILSYTFIFSCTVSFNLFSLSYCFFHLIYYMVFFSPIFIIFKVSWFIHFSFSLFFCCLFLHFSPIFYFLFVTFITISTKMDYGWFWLILFLVSQFLFLYTFCSLWFFYLWFVNVFFITAC